MLRRPLYVLALVALAACSVGASAPAGQGPHSCPAFGGPMVTDPMTDPPAGATGVATTIGHVTVPAVPGLAGLTFDLIPVVNGTTQPFDVQGGTFAAGLAGTLTATIPPLGAGTTYFAQATQQVGTGALGCPLYEVFFLGSFTTQ